MYISVAALLHVRALCFPSISLRHWLIRIINERYRHLFLELQNINKYLKAVLALPTLPLTINRAVSEIPDN